MSYIQRNFLLRNKTAEKLYFDVAKDMPIFDYHCHLSEKEIFEDKPIKDIYEVWLKGDHYKWRLMRNFGIDEEYITGSKSNKEKFIAYCKTIEGAIGNPLYHWSQLELEKYFDCDLEINEKNAEKIWEQANAYIEANQITPSKLIKSSNVTYIFTTNHPLDSLEIFDKINSENRGYEVYPAFRADALVNISAYDFASLIFKLGVNNFDEFEKIIRNKIGYFVEHGCKVADISLSHVYPIAERELAKNAFEKKISGKAISQDEAENYMGYLTYFLAKEFNNAGLALEMHLGARRNNNTKMFNEIGPDTGYDSINEDDTTDTLSKLMDRLKIENSLPRILLFNLNKKMNTELLTLMGCFQDSSAKGKIQYGPAWWFLDNKIGIENHLKDLTSLAHLDAFVGMLTDSRSLLSYERHQYFRRILCNYIGELVENGEATKDFEILKNIVANVSYTNSVKYFKLK